MSHDLPGCRTKSLNGDEELHHREDVSISGVLVNKKLKKKGFKATYINVFYLESYTINTLAINE